jgi:hypothetical protein
LVSGELILFPVSPQAYARVIEARAWKMLNSPDGFNGYTAAEIKAWRRNPSRNTVGVAVHRASLGVVPIVKSNCRKIEARIRRRFKDEETNNAVIGG